MSNSQPLPPKKEVALALLERSNDRGIFVHLDPRHAGRRRPSLVQEAAAARPPDRPEHAGPHPRSAPRRRRDELHAELQPVAVLLRRALVERLRDGGRGRARDGLARRRAGGGAALAAGAAAPRRRRSRGRPARCAPSRAARRNRSRTRTARASAKPKRVRKRPPLAAVPDGEAPAKKGRGARTPLTPVKQLADAVQAASPRRRCRRRQAGPAPGRRRWRPRERSASCRPISAS